MSGKPILTATCELPSQEARDRIASALKKDKSIKRAIEKNEMFVCMGHDEEWHYEACIFTVTVTKRFWKAPKAIAILDEITKRNGGVFITDDHLRNQVKDRIWVAAFWSYMPSFMEVMLIPNVSSAHPS